MKLLNVKGANDSLPQKEIVKRNVINTLTDTFEKFGYLPLDTTILCHYDLLASKYSGGSEILKEIYTLKDQGKRQLGLRYDLTVPFAKVISMNAGKEINLPFKRYEINKVFRDGPVKVGRDREFTQCDVDVVGLSNQMIEAELVSLYVNAFTKLNIEINIKYNSRNLMKGLILDTGVSEDLVSSTITIIDKIDKLTTEELTNSFLELGLESKQIKLL